MKKKLFILWLIGLPCFITAVGEEKDNEKEMSVTRERIFTGSGLYGFMNGGADLFLEYGVSRLVTRDVVYNKEEYTIDIYELPTPEDAFGIYSMHVFECEKSDCDNTINCLSPYQLQAVVDNKYISVVFASGSEAARGGAGEVMDRFVEKETDSVLSIPVILIPHPPYSAVIKYLRGPLSISSASKELSRLMKDVSFRGIWFKGDRREGTFTAYILTDGEEAGEVIKNKLDPDLILEESEEGILISGQEKEEESPDFGPFGF